MTFTESVKANMFSDKSESLKTFSNNIIRLYQEDNKSPFTIWIQPRISAEEVSQRN